MILLKNTKSIQLINCESETHFDKYALFNKRRKNMDSKDELTFEICKITFEKSQLPSDSWHHMTRNKDFVVFVELEGDFIIKKKVIIFKDLSVKIFINDNLFPLCQFIRLKNIVEVESLLKVVDLLES